MASLHLLSTPMSRVLIVHDPWVFGANLDKGDVDDNANCFYMAEQCKELIIYIVNDTGDGRRYKAFCDKYERLLRVVCPTVVLVSGNVDLTGVTKVILCAPLHPEHDAVLVSQLRVYRPECRYYAQGDSPSAYNMNGSALTPFLTFGEKPTLSVQDESGTHLVPISLYNTSSTNRKFTLDQLRKFMPSSAIQDMVVYSKHKLCFLPSKPFALGLLLKKYGTGNTAYGLCHAMNLMELDDTRDPDVVLTTYLAKYGEGHTERILTTYPAIQAYLDDMKSQVDGKLDDPEDMARFQRVLMLVVECTILWFGSHALDRFRTLADSDVIATVTGDEKYSSSMFDLVVGIAVLNNITPAQLSALPGTANQLATGRLLTLLGV